MQSHTRSLVLPSTSFNDTPLESEFLPTTNSNIFQIISSIKLNAAGEDGIPIRFIKLILPLIIDHLTHITNYCLMTSTFPDCWKLASVIPVAKKLKISSANDFRPISILPCLSKVLEKVIAKQICSHLHQQSLLYPLQSGFRAEHSCSTAMVNVLNDIRIKFDEGYVTLLCLLDFSKAFDTVNHELLCWKLRRYFNFSSSATRLLKSFLTDRLQKVIIAGKSSVFKPVEQGVPQGSILGPILFCMFINDLPHVCKYVTTHLYADDVQLCLSRSISNINDLALNFNHDLSAIHRWSVENGLLLNPTKSQIIAICNRSLDISLLPDIFLSCSKLTYSQSVKSLGFILNRNLSCYDHINIVVGRIYGCLRKLWLSANFTPIETRRKLVIALIIPIITYAEVVYSNLDSLSQHKLQVAFNDSVRYIYGLRRYDRISELSRNVLGCSLQQYLNARNCIFLHNIITRKTPEYLYSRLNFSRSHRTFNINIPTFRYLNSSRLFFIHSIRLWNSLPIHIKRINSPFNFKNSIINYYSMR